MLEINYLKDLQFHKYESGMKSLQSPIKVDRVIVSKILDSVMVSLLYVNWQNI